MPDWLQGNEWAAWLALALILGVVEAATVDLVFAMLAGGAFAAFIAAAVGFGLAGQVIIAGVVAVALLGFVRPVAKKRLMEGKGDEQPIGVARYVGRVGVAMEAIDEHRGLLRIDGDDWTARIAAGDTPIAANTQGRITAVDGATLVVTAASPVQDLPRREIESD